jgi:antitoxin ParD1/3/4
MALHVSLPTELETLVHQEVKTGMYGSASEVVREALRKFFQHNDITLSPVYVQELRLRTEEACRHPETLIDGREFFSEMSEEYGI